MPHMTTQSAVERGGCQVHRFKSTGTNKAAVVKAAPGQLYGLSASSVDETPVYLRLYNKTTSPTTGDTPVGEYVIPGSGSGIGSGREKSWPLGLEFTTGIAYRVTTGAADDNDDACSANEVIITFDYR